MGSERAFSAVVHETAPEVRVKVMGAPDQTFEHAPRSSQLASAGLTAEGIAESVRARKTEESLSTA